jgi:hypothetical protein
MKISDLIAQLQYCQLKFGDLDVLAYKSGHYLDHVEKLVHLEAVRNIGTPDLKSSSPQDIAKWSADPQLQPNAGWLPLPMKGLDSANIASQTKHRVLYLGPKIVVTSS